MEFTTLKVNDQEINFFFNFIAVSVNYSLTIRYWKTITNCLCLSKHNRIAIITGMWYYV